MILRCLTEECYKRGREEQIQETDTWRDVEKPSSREPLVIGLQHTWSHEQTIYDTHRCSNPIC